MIKPFDEFRQQVRGHQKDIEVSQGSMLHVYHLISKEKHIGPGQCARIVKSIDIIGEPIRECCELMNTPESLPHPVRPLRHHLMITLQQADGLISSLTSNINNLHIICKDSSNQEVDSYRQGILEQLMSLVQSKDDIVRDIDILLLEANPGKFEPVSARKRKTPCARVTTASAS